MRSVMADDFDVTRQEGPRLSAPLGEMFSSEEMQAIREQYEERIAASEERAEELEFQVKRALAAVRDAETDLAKVRRSLEALVDPAADELTQPRISPSQLSRAQPHRSGPVIGEPVMGAPGVRARPSTLPGRPPAAPAPAPYGSSGPRCVGS